MTDQNHPGQSRPDQPRHDRGGDEPGQYQQGQSQQGRPLEDIDGQPRYGVRLTPEQLAEHQAQEPPSGSHPHQPAQSPYGQPAQQEYPPPSYGEPGQPGQSPYGQPGEPASYPSGQAPAGYAQQPYPQQSYPQQPYGYPGQAQQPMGPVEKPKEIDRSYWLIVAAGVAFLIIELIAAFSPAMGLTPQMTEELESQLEATGVTVDIASLMDSVRVVAIVFTVIVAALYVLVATGIRRGSNVARIFGTIFAVLSLPAAFGVGIIYVALGIAGIVFAYLRPSSEYFRGKAWERALRR